MGAIPSVQPGVACCGRDGRTPRNFIPVCEQFRLLQCSAAKPQRIGVRPSPASPGAATLGAWRCGSNPERPARRRLLRPGRPHTENFIPACEEFRLLQCSAAKPQPKEFSLSWGRGREVERTEPLTRQRTRCARRYRVRAARPQHRFHVPAQRRGRVEPAAGKHAAFEQPVRVRGDFLILALPQFPPDQAALTRDPGQVLADTSK